METKARYTLTHIEDHNLPAGILEILENHRGIGNSITGAHIAQRFGYSSDRKIRVAIQQLVADGKPIAASVSDPVGYYLVETREEAEAYAAVLRSRAIKILKRLHNFQRAIQNEFGVPYQPVLLPVDTAQAIRDADAREMW
jgi:hypothetical protein